MALEGNLKDFSLADMFRLLQTGSKTGVLNISRDDVSGFVCFRDGMVYSASAGEVRELVGKRLTRLGVISEKQLRQAQGLMKIQKKDKATRGLGQILVDEGYLEASILDAFIREQVADALFDLLRWDSGQLRFDADKVVADADLGIAVSIEAVLGDANKRLETWNKIKEKIPSVDTRFCMAATPGSKSIDIHLKPREWMLLCHLHGSRSVSDLVELTGYSDFDTARILYGMYASGLIEKVGPAGEPLSE